MLILFEEAAYNRLLCIARKVTWAFLGFRELLASLENTPFGGGTGRSAAVLMEEEDEIHDRIFILSAVYKRICVLPIRKEKKGK